MTVLDDTGRTQIIATEGQTELEIGFSISSSQNISADLATRQLRVTKWDGTVQTDLQYGIGLDYLLSENLQQVILNNPATAGDVYTILLNPPRTQGVTYPQGSFSPLTQEAIVDQAARMSISLDYRLRRVPSLIATFSGQMPFNPKGNARKVIGISEAEDSFVLFNVRDITPPPGGNPEQGRIPQFLNPEGDLESSPLVNVNNVVVSETSMEVPQIKIGSTVFNSSTIGSIDFQLNGIGALVGITKVDDQIFLRPVEGGGGVSVEPGNIGYFTYFVNSNLLRVSPNLAFLDNSTICTDNDNDRTLTLSTTVDKNPSLLFQKFYQRTNRVYLTANTNYPSQIFLDLDPSEVVDGKFVQLYKDQVTLDGESYDRISLRSSDEDPRGNVALSPQTPNPAPGALGVWEGHNDTDNIKYMYASQMKIITDDNTGIPFFEGGVFKEPDFTSVSFKFGNVPTADQIVNINLDDNGTHYITLVDTSYTINMTTNIPLNSMLVSTILLVKATSQDINLTWGNGSDAKFPLGIKYPKLVGPEDSVFEFHVEASNSSYGLHYFVTLGIQQVTLDTDTVVSIAQDAQENQIVKYVGVTGKFITNDTPTIDPATKTLKNFVFTRLTRKFHTRTVVDVNPIGGVLTLDLDVAMVFRIDVTGGITNIIVNNITPGARKLILLNTTDETITYPNFFFFEKGIPPELKGESHLQLFVETSPELQIVVTPDFIDLQ